MTDFDPKVINLKCDFIALLNSVQADQPSLRA